MAYATAQDLVARFGEDQIIQLSDRMGTGLMDESIIAQAIADADAVVNGYLAGRYSSQLPLDPVPPVVLAYVCDLARLNLYPDAVPDEVQKRADRAHKFFDAVGKGQINLGVVPEPASDNQVQMVTVDRRREGIGL